MQTQAKVSLSSKRSRHSTCRHRSSGSLSIIPESIRIWIKLKQTPRLTYDTYRNRYSSADWKRHYSDLLHNINCQTHCDDGVLWDSKIDPQSWLTTGMARSATTEMKMHANDQYCRDDLDGLWELQGAQDRECCGSDDSCPRKSWTIQNFPALQETLQSLVGPSEEFSALKQYGRWDSVNDSLKIQGPIKASLLASRDRSDPLQEGDKSQFGSSKDICCLEGLPERTAQGSDLAKVAFRKFYSRDNTCYDDSELLNLAVLYGVCGTSCDWGLWILRREWLFFPYQLSVSIVTVTMPWKVWKRCHQMVSHTMRRMLRHTGQWYHPLDH